MTFYDFAKHQKTVSYTTFWSLPKVEQIPYKTCRLLILLEPFAEKGPQKYQKSIRFFTTTRIGFYQVEKPYKPNGKWMIS